MGVHAEFQQTARDIDGARQMTGGIFLRLAYVHYEHPAQAPGNVLGRDFADSGLGAGDQFGGGGYGFFLRLSAAEG